MSQVTVSMRSRLVLAAGVAAVALQALFISSNLGGETGTLWISDLGEALIIAVSAVFVLRVAFSFGPEESLRRQWVPIGIGMLMFALGDLVWTYLEAYRGLEVPYPGLPDLFYVLEYPFLAYGLIRAGAAYRGLVPLRKPLIAATVTVVALAAVVIVGLVIPTVLPADASVAEKVLSSLYPLADVVFGLGPALFLVFVVRKLGGGRLAWPWWSVAVGVVLLALADASYSWLAAFDLYESGMVIDYGWSMGHVFMAFGAALALDLARPGDRR